MKRNKMMAQRQRWKSELLVAKSEHPSARPEIFLLLSHYSPDSRRRCAWASIDSAACNYRMH